MSGSRLQILNGSFDPLTLDEAVTRCIEHVEAGERGWLCTVNVAILMMMRHDPFLQGFVERAKFVVADGQPLVWAAPMLGGTLPERVAGVELVEVLSARAAARGHSVYLMGATRDIVDGVASHLQATTSGLKLAGIADGYFGPDEASGRARAIADSGANILFVAMGVPRQERFLDEHWDELGVNLAIGVGGSFDVIAGVRSRAPDFVQKAGLEWLYRLAQEPRRLGKRYLTTNSEFLYRLGREIVERNRPFPSGR
ncbi:MAG: WecB/TagA/CpsF family glycosyltransferase [Myxococcales bacterium]|nr:WecB/TagA/CpsF family glycosyltransferase [Myxococcales bacterium]MDD9966812.1 WecB/TagA/CpsF family glycosyltransferase [Myxococcales bacterium]